MTSPQDHRPTATPRVWPARPADLVDTSLCPACFRSLSGPLCRFCGLDLDSPEATRLLEFGRLIVDTEAARQSTIERMRAASEAARLPAPVAPQPPRPPGWSGRVSLEGSASQADERDRAGAPVPATAAPESGSFPTTDPRVITADTERPLAGTPRRSSAQILLLTAGVVLVSVFAIFFAVLAYVVASVETRSVLTAAASLLVLGVAWLLRRRGLDGTAEGIAVIGVVLLLLDVWIVRVNRLFSADALDGGLYTGLAFLVVSVVLIGVSRLTGLRAPSVSAAVIAPSGVFALVFGATEPIASEWTSVLLAASAAVVVVLVERVPGVRRVEAAILRSTSIAAGVLALLAAIPAFPSREDGAVLGFAVALVAWSVQLLTVHRGDGAPDRPHGGAWAVVAAVGVAAAIIGLTSSALIATAESIEQGSGLHSAAMTVVAALILSAARIVPTPLSRSLRISGAVVATGAALSLAPVVAAIVPPLAAALIADPFRTAPLSPVLDAQPGASWFVVGAALTSAAAIRALVALGSRRTLTMLAWLPVGLATLALLGGALLAPSLLATVVITIAGSAVLLLVAAWRIPAPSARVAAFTCAVVSACSVAALSAASTGSWLLGTLVALALLGAARLVAWRAPRPLGQAGGVVSSALGAGVLLWTGSLLPTWVALVTRRPDLTPLGFGAAVAAVVIIGALAFAVRRTSASEIAVVGGLAIVVLVPSAVAVWVTAALVADAGWRVVFTALAVIAAAAWIRLGRRAATRAVAAGVGIGSLTLLAAESAVLVSAGSSSFPGGLAGAGILSVLAAVRLVTARMERTRSAAAVVIAAAEWSVAATAAAVLALALADGGPLTRLTLLVLALVPTLLAFTPSPQRAMRHQVAWVGAALAVVALWWFLADERVTAIEFYSLPVAGLLLTVGGVAGVAGRGSQRERPAREHGGSVSGLEVLLGSGLAIAILPSAFGAGAGGPLRAIVTAAVGVALIALALAVLRDDGRVRLRSIIWIAGIVAVSLPVVVRLVDGEPSAAGGIQSAAMLATWLGPVVLVLVAAALGAFRIRRSPVLGDVAAMTVIAAIGITVTAALSSDAIDGGEASPWLLISSAVTVVAFSLFRTRRVQDGPGIGAAPSSRERPSVRILAVVGAVTSLVIATTSLPSVDDVEWVSVPLGVAAVTIGVIHLRRDPAVGSWPTLAFGLLVVLLPSLARDVGDPELWRVIALGAAGVAVTIVGARARLQAPLVIGAVVTIVHGLAQLWPWISGLYDAGYWWVWAGVGGVLLIVFAARYEQRMENLRAVGRVLRSLR